MTQVRVQAHTRAGHRVRGYVRSVGRGLKRGGKRVGKAIKHLYGKGSLGRKGALFGAAYGAGKALLVGAKYKRSLRGRRMGGADKRAIAAYALKGALKSGIRGATIGAGAQVANDMNNSRKR
jgi:hypothetical protein